MLLFISFIGQLVFVWPIRNFLSQLKEKENKYYIIFILQNSKFDKSANHRMTYIRPFVRSTCDLKLRFDICKLWVFNVTFKCQKSSKKLFIEKYKIRSITFIIDTFCFLSFLKHVITKIGPKFQTLISNCALI